uniref:RecQ-mediated genome instability protein 1 n=1 Tax=Ditylenchus dipsaci TaxID=166011 RepID=A0A915CRM0_9BILA
MNDIMTTTLLDYFATENHIRLKQEWLECAINYLSVSGTSRTRYNGMLFEQWLYSDIGESTLPCLKNVFNGKKLNGVIVLQVVSAADDGSSFHSQSSQLPYRANDSSKFQYESEVHNFRRNAGSNRIQMVLSDGRDQVKAVEHNPIPYLSALIRPGCKVLLYGAIGVTQGIFLLEPNNCQVLGGDVEIRPPLAATSTSSLGDLAAFFSQYHIRIRQEWLECAVKYISTSRADKTFHSGIIFEQWLYSDIGESTLPCLKEAISGNTLNGVIVLQVVSVLGGDSPLPIELKQLVYEKNDNDVFQYPDTAASSRIHIVLSDGRDEIKAVEHKAIPHLLDFLRPGCKVLLYGVFRYCAASSFWNQTIVKCLAAIRKC